MENEQDARMDSQCAGDTSRTAPTAQPIPSYDEKQAGAVLVTRRCCRRTVYATHPAGECATCR